MRWRDVFIICWVLAAICLHSGCSGSSGAKLTPEQAQEKAKPSLEAGGRKMQDMYKAGQGGDASKMLPNYPPGYPGMSQGGPPKGGNP